MEKNQKTRAGKGRMVCRGEESGDISGVSKKDLCVKDKKTMKLRREDS